LALYDAMEKAKDLIINVNAITEEEISAVFPAWLDLMNHYYGDDDEMDDDDFNDLENLDTLEDWEDLDD